MGKNGVPRVVGQFRRANPAPRAPQVPSAQGADRMSAPYLSGAKIDFVDTIEKQGFTIDNPNATGSCACGDSFH